jgi:hypothetical protein
MYLKSMQNKKNNLETKQKMEQKKYEKNGTKKI